MNINRRFRKHCKLLEESASGLLQKQIAKDPSKEAVTENSEVNLSLANNIFSCGASKDCTSFGSEHWALYTVYLASTPQQAAAMGLKFPGVDEGGGYRRY